MPATAFAHSKPGRPESEWHVLEDHLLGVGELAASFARGFGAERMAYAAGAWHDLGKYASDFQAYLRADHEASNEAGRGRIDHSSAGAILAHERGKGGGSAPLVAFAIAGHHSGLSDGVDLFQRRIPAKQDRLRAARAAGIPPNLLAIDAGPLPSWVQTKTQAEMLGRMIFSALIDADRLDTEKFCDPESAAARSTALPTLVCLRDQLARHIVELSTREHDRDLREAVQSLVNTARAAVVRDCQTAATRPPGIFTLTAPTGTGKTLAAMLFALEHAVKYNLDRVIVAIPYTSIIEQTADVYRSIFGSAAVIEHHSSIEPELDTDENRRACENWDAPIVVTTNVQLLESLFTHRPSRVRKLHSVARSVVILDEAQTLPPGLLEPIVDGLRDLVAHYGLTLLIATATQPASAWYKLKTSQPPVPVTEIVHDPKSLFSALARVDVVMPADLGAPMPLADIVSRVRLESQALVITHRRADARELAQALPDAYHLSAAMCPAHRSVVLHSIRERLKERAPCLAVTTQVVEAGVDIDFPFVMRALGPLDSLAQAAGRCNREGRLVDDAGRPTRGRFEVFVAATPPPRDLKPAADVSRTVLELRDRKLDLSDPSIFSEYFDRLYGNADLDRERIQRDRELYAYRLVGQHFKLISDDQVPVVVPYRDYDRPLSRLRWALERGIGERAALRNLQPFMVSVYRSLLGRLRAVGALDEVDYMLFVLRPDHLTVRYDERLGLVESQQPGDVRDLII
jgi:CRISPR-associated endonuclease/helicase Cas3